MAGFADRPVGMLIVTRHGATRYYSAGVSASDFSKPSAHFLMHQAIVDAKGDGLKRFEFGDIHTGPDWPDKLRSIGHFKMGFTHTTSRKVWFSVPTRLLG